MKDNNNFNTLHVPVYHEYALCYEFHINTNEELIKGYSIDEKKHLTNSQARNILLEIDPEFLDLILEH